MRKLFEIRHYIKFNNQEPIEIRLFSEELCYKEPLVKKIEVNTFNQLTDLIKSKTLPIRFELSNKVFSKKEKVCIYYNWCDYIKITEKNFQPFTYYTKAIEVGNRTLDRLFKTLTAREFLNYLRDNGISFNKDNLSI